MKRLNDKIKIYKDKHKKQLLLPNSKSEDPDTLIWDLSDEKQHKNFLSVKDNLWIEGYKVSSNSGDTGLQLTYRPIKPLSGGILQDIIDTMKMTVVKVDFELENFITSINPAIPKVITVNKYYLEIGQAKISFSARVKTKVIPDITSKAYGKYFADNLCKKWEIGFLQNAIKADIVINYIDSIYKQTLKNSPTLDAEIETEPLNTKQAVEYHGQIISISSSDTPWLIIPFYDKRVGLRTLQGCSDHSEFITWLVVHNTKTNEYKYLKNIQWKFYCDLDIDLDKNVFTILSTSKIIKVFESDGQGIYTPTTEPPIANSEEAYNFIWEAK